MQAIATAEGETKGRAVSAGAEDVNGRVLYEIELVAADDTKQKAYVDATSGAIVEAVAGEDQGNGDADHEDGDADREDGDDDHEHGGHDHLLARHAPAPRSRPCPALPAVAA